MLRVVIFAAILSAYCYGMVYATLPLRNTYSLLLQLRFQQAQTTLMHCLQSVVAPTTGAERVFSTTNRLEQFLEQLNKFSMSLVFIHRVLLQTNGWRPSANMTHFRYGAAVATLDNKIYAMGGTNASMKRRNRTT